MATTTSKVPSQTTGSGLTSPATKSTPSWSLSKPRRSWMLWPSIFPIRISEDTGLLAMTTLQRGSICGFPMASPYYRICGIPMSQTTSKEMSGASFFCIKNLRAPKIFLDCTTLDVWRENHAIFVKLDSQKLPLLLLFKNCLKTLKNIIKFIFETWKFRPFDKVVFSFV